MAAEKTDASSRNWHQSRQASTRGDAIYDERKSLHLDLIRQLKAATSAEDLDAKLDNGLTEVVQAYNASLFALQSIRSDAETFINTLCARHFQTDRPDLAREEYADATACVTSSADKPEDYLSLPVMRVSVNLEPGLFGLSDAAGAKQLASDLANSIEALVTGFLRVLDRLVELRILGTIEWPVPTACRIRYFQTKIEATQERDVETETTVNDRRWKQTFRETDVKYTLHGQQQHLAHARRIELPTYRGSMPIRVRQLCDNVPVWLEERIDIVDGQLFRSDHVEEHLRTESRTELVEETQLSFLDDPAITLGPFVLATWLPQEILHEQHQASRQSHQRQREIEQQQEAARLHSYWPLAIAVSLQAIPLCGQLLACWRWAALHTSSIALALLLIIPLLVLLRPAAIAHQIRPSFTVYLIAGGSLAGTIVGVHLLLISAAYWSALLFFSALLLSGIGMILGRELVAMFRLKQTAS